MLELREYQHRGVQFWMDNPSCYYAVDMGLGKTAMVLTTLLKIKKRAFIFAPIRPMYTTWPEEIEKWAPELTYTILHGPNKDSRLSLDRDVYIIPPSAVKWLYNALAKQYKCGIELKQEVLVVDEGSMWKDPSTQRFKFIKAMLPLFPKWRVILSGTPSPNSLLNLWSQYFILDEGVSLGAAYTRFRGKYFQRSPWNIYDFFMKEGSAESIHKAVSPITFRLDSKDHISLPQLLYRDVELEMKPSVKKQYNTLKKEFALEIDGVTIETLNEAAKSMKLRQFVQGALYIDEKYNYKVVHQLKIDALKDLVEEADGSPILCAVQFKFEHDLIKEAFPDTPFIVGGTSDEDAVATIKKWNKGEIPLMCGHPQSIGHGTNLQTGGHIVVWFGLTWSLEQYLQLNKRLHRSGQEERVVVYRLIVKGTVDTRVAEVLGRKDATQQMLLDYLREETINDW